MKCKNLIPFIALLLVPLSYACDNGNDPTPVYSGPRICERDSVALTDIYYQAFGEMPDTLCKEISIKGKAQKVILNQDLSQSQDYYVESLNVSMYCPSTSDEIKFDSKLSDKINDLVMLEGLWVGGDYFTGDFPSISSLNRLKYLHILSTRFSTLPDDIFTEHLMYADISWNPELKGNLPSSIAKLKSPMPSAETGYNPRFSITRNGFTGDIPFFCNAAIDLSYNELTYLPFEILDFASLRYRIIHAEFNNISGIIPEDVLNDTLKITRLYRFTDPQISGGYENMPPEEEIIKMAKEYRQNHPEQWLNKHQY